MTDGSMLVHLDKAKIEIELARTVDEVKSIRDKAEVLRMYVKRSGMALEIQNHCAEIKLRAERKAGELLEDMELHGGDRKSESRLHDVTLKNLGVEKTESHRWQRIASLDEPIFEQHIARTKHACQELTTVGLLRLERSIRNENRNNEAAHTEGTISRFSLIELASQGKQFGTIYADPPWKYSNQATRAATDNHYPTLSPDELAGLGIDKLAADDSHLHLWTTNAFLFECQEIMTAWGFEYKSVFVWVKPQMGIGNYWRVSHEFLLLGTRGNCPFLDRSQMSWGEFPRTKHSSKPESVRRIIEKVSPGPRLELFGRRKIDGWTVIGNQIEETLFDPAEISA